MSNMERDAVCPTCPPGSPIHVHQTESTLWTEVGQAHGPEAENKMEYSSPSAYQDK